MKKSIGPRTLAFPTPVWVVGTYDANGKPNAMTAAWACICCSKPPAIGVSLRKATYTYGNIVARQAFTISVPSEAHVREADYLGMATGKEVNKFAATRLTPVASTLVDAPFVEEFPLVLECKVIHTLEIGLHTLFIGEILDVKADPGVIWGTKASRISKKPGPSSSAPRSAPITASGNFWARPSPSAGTSYDMIMRKFGV